jgi:hypothetical protein
VPHEGGLARHDFQGVSQLDGGPMVGADEHGTDHQRSGNQSGGAFSFDGLTLYFNAAKDSRPGFGKFDLFATTRSRVSEEGWD